MKRGILVLTNTSQRKSSKKVPILVSAPLYWCPRCNVPLLGSKCGKCGGDGYRLRVTPPGDVRPALSGDLKRLKAALLDYFDSSEAVFEFIDFRKPILLNKIPYPDAADEVIVDGQIVGHLFYDVLEEKWRFKPLYSGVARILEKKLAPYAVISLERVARRFEVKKTEIVELSGEWTRGRFISVGLASGRQQAVGVIIRGRIRILKVWYSKSYLELPGTPTWLDVIRANEKYLQEKEAEAIKFIKDMVKKVKKPIFVSFSGGKDSLVTYYLTKTALGYAPPLLFNDTGIELPETVSYVKSFVEKENARLIYADAGEKFWHAVNIMGPPARDYRWCCKVVKLTPIAKAVEKVFPEGAVSVVGQRKYESMARARSPRVWVNKWIPKVIAIAPIQDWSALDVWLYIMRNRLTPNPLYFLGFDRLGCWLCPATELGEMRTVKEVYPELWSTWEAFLRKYGAAKNAPKEWIKLGLWRWVKIPGDIKRILPKELDKLTIRRGIEFSIKSEGSRLVIELEEGEIIHEKLREVLKIFPGKVKYRVSGKSVIFEDKKWGIHLLMALVRALFCVECEACALKCPASAIKIDGYPHIDAAKCSHCLICNTSCPIAVYTLKIKHNLNIEKLKNEYGL
ncbi:MAG: phosphoadenosine phosphosulfate reductase [Thermoprotei archaeon]|nr:MAG: phosphoadenosine phosphosulfate reductase [Thermoprotei archaeon]